MLFNELKIIILMFFSEYIYCNLHVVIYLDNCEYIVNVLFQTLPRLLTKASNSYLHYEGKKHIMLIKFDLFIEPFIFIFLQDCQCAVS